MGAEIFKWFIKVSFEIYKYNQEKIVLEGFVDAVYAKNVATRKSLFDFVFMLFGTTIV